MGSPAADRRVAVVLGTRPEAIKLAGIAKALGDAAWIIHTGQHYDAELGSDILDDLAFPPPHDVLDIGGVSRGQQIGQATERLDALFSVCRPAVVVVQGDTNSTLAGALAANAAEVPLVHVEAGLRSRDWAMPEEHNRVVADHLADLCCAPTDVTAANLAAEGIDGARVSITGNPIVEAVVQLLPPPEQRRVHLESFGLTRNEFVLATIHRPENTDDRDVLRTVLRELGELPFPAVLPLHPRTASRVDEFSLRPELDRLRVVSPLTPSRFLALAAEAAFWVSDSGGLQEEASVLKRPVIVVRRSTERPEVLGTFARLIPPGTSIRVQAQEWSADVVGIHEQLAGVPSPYCDGTASVRISDAVLHLIR